MRTNNPKVDIHSLKRMRELVDNIWRGRFNALPTRMMGAYVINWADGVNRVLELMNDQNREAHALLEELDEIISKAEGTWDKVPE